MEKRRTDKASLVLILFLAVCLLGLFGPQDTYAAKSQPALTNQSIPGDMAKGTPFTVEGTVSCPAGLSVVEVGVVNASTGNWVSAAHRKENVTGKTYDLSAMDPYMAFRSLDLGEYYYKIKIKDVNGTTTVLNRSAFSIYGKSSFTLKNNPYPTTLTQGKGFNVEGTVTSANVISKIRVGVVFKSSGKWAKVANATDHPRTKTYDLSNLDASIKFAQLEAGEYYYRIIVTDVAGTSKTVRNKAFTVKKEATVASSFGMKNFTYPIVFAEGSGFTVKGTVISANKITSLTVGVVNKSTGKWVTGAYTTVKPGAKTYDLNKVDAVIGFRKLAAGDYYYRVKVTDAKGTTKTLRDKAFYVTEKAGINLRDNPYPTTLNEGTPFTVEGKLLSTRKMTKVRAGAVNKSTGKWVSGANATASPDGFVYDLSKLDSSIAFSKLPAGSYYYRIAVTDYTGKTVNVRDKAFTVKGRESETASSFSIKNNPYPTYLAPGDPFTVEGTVTSKYKMTSLTCGVVDKSTGKWVTGAYKTVKPSATTYDLSGLDSSIAFSKLASGDYYYRVKVTDSKGTTKNVRNKAFTVTMEPGVTVSGTTSPAAALVTGSTFDVKGTVKSNNKISKIRAGIVYKSSGNWVAGANITVYPVSKTYDLTELDSGVKFSILLPGEYYYRVVVTDVTGYEKRVINKSFTVKSAASLGVGKILSYNQDLISRIGAQPYSGPCGVYCMAYGRSILDGRFSKGKYSTYHECIIAKYSLGNSSGYAYWNTANAYSTICSTQSLCYKNALREIKEGRPCILSLTNTYSGSNHYVLVIGYVKGTTEDNVCLSSFIVLDPVTASKRYLGDVHNYVDRYSNQIIRFQE